jgi:POT family proton-dependent oligopeptide transporter
MRSMVQAVVLFMIAFAAVVGQAFVGLAADPLLVWNYAVPAILAFVAGIGFYFQCRNLDIREDELNKLPEGQLGKFDAESIYGFQDDKM